MEENMEHEMETGGGGGIEGFKKFNLSYYILGSHTNYCIYPLW